MSATDKLIARVEVLSMALARSEEDNENLRDKLDEKTHQAYYEEFESTVAWNKYSAAVRDGEEQHRRNEDLKSENRYLRQDIEAADRQIKNLENEVKQLKEQLRLLKMPQFAGKSYSEVAKAIIEKFQGVEHEKIKCIKEAREALGIGLVEAKDLIESTYIEMGTHTRNYQGHVVVMPKTVAEVIKTKLPPVDPPASQPHNPSA